MNKPPRFDPSQPVEDDFDLFELLPGIPDAEDESGSADRPSKSQRKREMEALQKLGARLLELSRERLAQLPIPERLIDAVTECQRIRSHEGRRRQLQYIGKLMRQVDPQPISYQFAIWDGELAEATHELHALEARRERLLLDDAELTALLNEYPGEDAQEWRSVIRAARREQSDNARLGPGQAPKRKQFRALFQMLKSLPSQQENALPGRGLETRDTDDEEAE